ncbi:caspase family protein [Nonomuraea sp. NPDC005650]|uniref:caspase family protein n=1 Tax=Nonomuraea sp. NPDC005650 TaxID=3157045 RepID=UPI0033A9F455
MTRRALLIANSTYDDPRLRRLGAPPADVVELERVLADPAVGAFEVEILHDGTASHVRDRIAALFAGRRPNDVLLLYFSGHGLKDATGALYLAARDSFVTDLAGTGVTSDFVNACVQRCRSRRIVIILDCCYSGAFARGIVVRGDRAVHVQERFHGRGFAIITASSAIEYAFEDGVLTETDPRPSTFTRALIEGLDTGAADLDHDQDITLDELYGYVFNQVKQENPAQTPCCWVFGGQGRFVISRRRGPTPDPPRVPAPEPDEFRPPRWTGLLAGLPVAAGAGLVWFGVWAQLIAMVLGGGWLAGRGLVWLAMSQLGSTSVGREGVRVRPAVSELVRWPSVLAIEVWPGLLGRRIAVRRADTALMHRRALPGPRRPEEIEKIRDWSYAQGSPAPVLHLSRWAASRRVLAAVALVLALLAAVDQPWTRVTDPEAAALPRACDVLDADMIKRLDLSMGLMIDTSPSDNTLTSQISRCRWPVNVLILTGGGAVTLWLERFERDPRRSGAQRAAGQFAEYRDWDGAAGLRPGKTSRSLGEESYVAASGRPGTGIVRARRANVLVTAEVAVNGHQLTPSNRAFLEDVAATALSRVSIQRPGPRHVRPHVASLPGNSRDSSRG